MSQILTRLSMATVFAAVGVLTAGAGSRAFALSELSPAIESPRGTPRPPRVETLEAFEGTTLPQPGPAIDRPAAQANEKPAPSPDPDAGKAAGGDDASPLEIIRDMSKLPAPVKRMREQLVEAAASGDIERLRPLIGTGDNQAQVMNGESDDPIETLKSFSGDADGQEILAILLDILSTGAAHFDAGTPDEAYVWPYFTGKSLTSLTPPERVDLLRIVTAGDLAGMEENGNYNFFRIGIGPDGKWKFFAGGD
ncbi:hypothetical protein ACFFP0_20520 [Rhizobium puerariae]|uniref:Uncharacterized protein n=1 Tax=Rhizobium puerariae TaxID=1585791 RepID=A0ABV6AKU3_9HYPH